MERIRVNRKELLDAKRLLEFAERGLKLLDLKRSSLLLELSKLEKEVKERRKEIEELHLKAKGSIDFSLMHLGMPFISKYLINEPLRVEIEYRKDTGISIPNIKIKETAKDLPPSIKDIENVYAKLLNAILEISIKELIIARILYEIKKLNRKTNSLEYDIIPSLRNKIKYIYERMEDMERESNFLIKFIKEHKDNGRD